MMTPPYTENGKLIATLTPMISRIHLPISAWAVVDPEDVLEVEREPDDDQVGEHAEAGEQEERVLAISLSARVSCARGTAR